jgi:S-adenosylmethionine synthetase
MNEILWYSISCQSNTERPFQGACSFFCGRVGLSSFHLPVHRKGAFDMLCTCEQVSCGHPDKICDQIADAIVTDCLKHDPDSRVAVECMIKDYEVFIAGEITSKHKPDFRELVRGVLRRIGVPNADQYMVLVFISEQSTDFARGVDSGGAGDQGIVYGYATDETPELMPLPFMVATHALEILRRIDFPYLRPDAKAQVTFDYKKRRIETFLISCQHTEDVPMEVLRIIIGCAMICAAAHYGLNRDFKMLVNPTGSFIEGGSFADTGVTGRKLMADSYGGVCRHGGGAFSGKDPTKIDRSGAYMARKIARDIVAADNAHRCEVQIAYAIGVAEPVSVAVNTFGTGKFSDDVLADLIRAKYDLTPRGIIESLHLKEVDYNGVSAHGHFGKAHLPWEQ